MTSSSTIAVAILAAGTIIAIAVYFTTAQVPSTTTGTPSLVRPVDATDHILGNPTASVYIIEYTDFDCEFCKDFHTTMQQVIANEGTRGNVAWVLRQFPLTEIHTNALSHAQASECAATIGGNDAFWRFADALFSRQPADPSSYGTIASSVGISNTDFATCYATAKTGIVAARIAADRQNALDIGARGTPYSILMTSGEPPVVLDGAYTYDAIKQFIDQSLTK
jgi:protein-disulfide isomerase